MKRIYSSTFPVLLMVFLLLGTVAGIAQSQNSTSIQTPQGSTDPSIVQPLGTCMTDQDNQPSSASPTGQDVSVSPTTNPTSTSTSTLQTSSEKSNSFSPATMRLISQSLLQINKSLSPESGQNLPAPPPTMYQSQRHAPILRPYIYSGMELSNAGYKPLSAIFGIGLDWERRHSLGYVEAWGDNATKGGFRTGYDFGSKIRGFYKLDNGYYFGGGYQWSRLVTPNYEKQSGRPSFGLGRDVKVNKVRAQVLYLLPGTDHVNALQGPDFTLWIPSPTRPGHWFFREDVGAYEFHASANPWNDGTHERGTAAFTETTIMFRF